MSFVLDIALLTPVAFGASCDPAAISAALGTAERAFPTGDAPSMEAALFSVRKGLACTRDPMSPELCAQVHRAYALQHWLQGDQTGARLELQAMLNADPHYQLPDLIVGERHPLRAVLTQAEEVVPTWTDAPGSGWVLVDGVKTGAVPREQPYLLQSLKADGKAGGARLVERSPQEGSGARGRVDKRAALRITGAGLGVAAIGLYGGAWASRGSYEDAVTARDNERIAHTYGATNGLSIGSVVALGLGAGAAVSAQLVR